MLQKIKVYSRTSTLRYTEPAISNVHCRLYQDEDTGKKDPKAALVFLEDQRYVSPCCLVSSADQAPAKTAPTWMALALEKESVLS